MPPAEIASGIDYFFALRPDSRARAEIAGAAARFRRAQRASGVPVPIDNLHLSLCPMGRPERLRQPLEHAMLAAGAAVRAKAFVVTLDTAMRCIPTGGQFPFVLCIDQAAAEATLRLRKAIAEAQRAQGLRVNGVSSFHPHVALQSGPAIDAIEESITPIQWRAEEFVLIRSFFGQSSHEIVGRWPLPGEPAPAAIDLLAELANMPELPSLPDE
jgi:2'-5' RNA ligase